MMYSLDCSYYGKQFPTIEELVEDVVQSGMDPNYEITYNDEPIGELLIDHVVF